MTTTDRVRLRYSNPDDPTPVTFAAFLEAVPGTVTPGDVFTVPTRAAEIMLREGEDGEQLDGRWSEAPGDVESDAHPDLTVAQMHERAAEIADANGLDVPEQPRTRAESSAILADLELRYPPVPEQTGGELAVGDEPGATAPSDTASDEDANR